MYILDTADVWQSESELAEYKKQAKLIFRKLNQNSEERASIESGRYFLQSVPFPYFRLQKF